MHFVPRSHHANTLIMTLNFDLRPEKIYFPIFWFKFHVTFYIFHSSRKNSQKQILEKKGESHDAKTCIHQTEKNMQSKLKNKTSNKQQTTTKLNK